ncbi:alpha/beta fold hydrolase [Spirochaeta cellobiosiphila]|uniref:alpha/beta fold hydrolase n=1 Tax=Spirochaeta cellobiosiphila TaxID=504483 RepID=UPI000417980B|nr:alpha/beta hydrolase [Spirochaeta cellobiosiphila]
MKKSKGLLFALLVLSLSLFMGCETTKREEPSGITRQEIQDIISQAQDIQTPRGINERKEIEIGGIKQWISVRGRDRRNPVLLFIHGGPGTTEMPVSWFYQAPLEDYFTVVQWDQRGGGKSVGSNDQAAVIPTITYERMINDGEEVLSYLQKEYGKEKIFVLGHSWGTLIGLELALRHPDSLYAYIGMGQVLSTHENEVLGYQFALEEARRNNNEKAIQELESIAPYPEEDGSLAVQEVLIQRYWVSFYGGMTWGRTNLDYEYNLRLLSPDYTDKDLEADNEAVNVVLKLLPQLVDIDYRDITKLDVPLFLFSGRHDYAVPSAISAKWFEELQAPDKKLVWFEHSAHMMPMEQPGKFLLHLIQDVRPIAVKAGDAAPEDTPGLK